MILWCLRVRDRRDQLYYNIKECFNGIPVLFICCFYSFEKIKIYRFVYKRNHAFNCFRILVPFCSYRIATECWPVSGMYLSYNSSSNGFIITLTASLYLALLIMFDIYLIKETFYVLVMSNLPLLLSFECCFKSLIAFGCSLDYTSIASLLFTRKKPVFFLFFYFPKGVKHASAVTDGTKNVLF